MILTPIQFSATLRSKIPEWRPQKCRKYPFRSHKIPLMRTSLMDETSLRTCANCNNGCIDITFWQVLLKQNSQWRNLGVTGEDGVSEVLSPDKMGRASARRLGFSDPRRIGRGSLNIYCNLQPNFNKWKNKSKTANYLNM